MSGVTASVLMTSNLASMVYFRDARKEIPATDLCGPLVAAKKAGVLGCAWPITFFILGQDVHTAYQMKEIEFVYPLFILNFASIYPAQSIFRFLKKKIDRGEMTFDEVFALLENGGEPFRDPHSENNTDSV